ncbi:MAG: hypothetical protein MUO54_03480 [Anaerolineales bacterium]|nr:hypothetical protein [Anaerolineales bacterium]
MEETHSPSVRSFLPITLLLAVPGWIWLIYLMTKTLPNLGNRWMFFTAAVIAITGSSIPVVAYLNRIIKPFGPATFEIIVRESTFLGIYAGILIWLNKGQVLTFGLAIILGIGLLIVESLIRFRTRSEWHPVE